jgi:ParB-like chromosome segregation protein Spo0J
MKIEQIATAALIPYAKNSRTHDEAQIGQIAGSIQEFGFTNPVLVDEENGIVAGHGRVLAALKLGLPNVPCIRLTGMTDLQRQAYVIADNKLALNAAWDDEMLRLELQELEAADFDLALLGFSDAELAALRVEDVAALTEEDAVPSVAEDAVSRAGDVWILGKHRVMCGDATSVDAVAALMTRGQKADMVFTDPPYGIGYTPKAAAGPGRNVTKARKAMVGTLIANDAEPADAMRVTTDALALHHDAPAHFVCCDWRSLGTITDAMRAAGIEPKACIVWDKGGPYQHLGQIREGPRTDRLRRTLRWAEDIRHRCVEVPARISGRPPDAETDRTRIPRSRGFYSTGRRGVRRIRRLGFHPDRLRENRPARPADGTRPEVRRRDRPPLAGLHRQGRDARG